MNIFTGLQIPKIIYETDSKYNGHIEVVEIGEVRKIKVDKVEQSISHTSQSCKRLVWGKTVDVLKENEPHLQKVLILGIGGGTVAHLISKEFPDAQIIGVEIDQVMVDIATNYFDIGSIPNFSVIVTDALRFVVEPEKYGIEDFSFDALIIDIFVGEKFPDLGNSGNFLSAIRKLVKPSGLIIFNRIYREHHQDDVNIFIDNVSEFLTGVKNLVVAGYTNSDNVLIYGRT